MSYGYREVSNREIIVSIAICVLMLILGLTIHENIENRLMREHQEYNTALQIENDTEMFQYGMRTNIGNAFVYGELKAINPVSYPEVSGAYIYIEKITERYTQHTRLVTKTRVNSDGETETYTEEETYWSWDEIDSESKCVEKISFLDVEFDVEKVNLPASNHIDTIKKSGNIRHIYNGISEKCTGTLYTVLGDNTINDAVFYDDKNIEQTIRLLVSNVILYMFWFFWLVLIIFAVVGFCKLDNMWLEDN